MKPLLRLLVYAVWALSVCAQAQVASRIELRTVQSAVLGIPKSFNIYLPKGYDTGSERYPVIYLFRGHEREWANGYEDNSRQGRTVKDDADDLIAQGLMGNVILVMPGMSSADNVVPTCGVNLLAPPPGVAGIGSGKFEDYLVSELIPYIDKNFRTIPSRSYRAVDGFSLGGYTSMMLATKHPELFTSAGSFDGTLMWLDFTNPSRPGSLNDLWVTNSMFDPMFNKPRNIPYMTGYNEANLVKNATTEKVRALRQMQFLLSATPAGNDDRMEHFISLLNAQGITNAFAPAILSPAAQHNWYYADVYAQLSFPKHWAKFQSPIVSLYSPLAGPVPQSSVSGTVPVTWLRGTRDTTAVTLLMVSSNGGETWSTLRMSNTRDSLYNWDTRLAPDGTRYMLRLLVISADSSLGFSQSAGTFTVNNPGNGVPDLVVTSPLSGDTLSGQQTVRWSAADADGDPLTISIEFSADNGLSWKTLASQLPNTGSYAWTTTAEVNSNTCRLRLRCSDGTASREQLSPAFAVKNARIALKAPFMRRLSGSGDGSIAALRIGGASISYSAYLITFNDTLVPGATVYSVKDQGRGQMVVQNAPIVNGAEGPLFDGMRLILTNYAPPVPSADSIRWTTGASTLEATVSLPEVNLGGSILKGIAYPADYLLTVSSSVVDTSGTFLDAAAVPMKFSLWNKTENRRAEVIFNDNDGDQTVSRNDELYIVEKNAAGQKSLAWQIIFSASDSYVRPAAGDRMLIKIMKPFTWRDSFELRPSIDAVEARTDVPDEFRLEQNYPNPFNPTTQIRFAVPRALRVRVRVYDLLGREVALLVDGMVSAGVHTAEWNARGFSSGMYVYRLEAGEYSNTKKLVLIR